MASPGRNAEVSKEQQADGESAEKVSKKGLFGMLLKSLQGEEQVDEEALMAFVEAESGEGEGLSEEDLKKLLADVENLPDEAGGNELKAALEDASLSDWNEDSSEEAEDSEKKSKNVESKAESAVLKETEEQTKIRNTENSSEDKTDSKIQKQGAGFVNTASGEGEKISDKKEKVSRPNQATPEVRERSAATGQDNDRRSIQPGSAESSRAGSNAGSERGLAFQSLVNGENSAQIATNLDEGELTDQQKKLLQGLLGGVQSAEATEKGVELRNLKAQQIRDKKSRRSEPAPFAQRGELSGERKGFLSLSNENPRSGNPSVSQTGVDMNLSSSGGDHTPEEEEIFWNHHTSDGGETRESRGQESQQIQFARLGQMPVSNITLRRTVMPGLTQAVSQAAASSKSAPESWQNHNFTLEDGKKIQLSARQVDGVLQLKLGSSHLELNKLLQQHYQEIKDHLERECNVSIDLQLDSQGGETLSDLFGDSSPGKGGGKGQLISGPAAEENSGPEASAPAIRRFGYNQMEWTA